MKKKYRDVNSKIILNERPETCLGTKRKGREMVVRAKWSIDRSDY
jgi:hypothetical protein